MAIPLAQVSDVAVRWPAYSSTSDDLIAAKLQDASALMRAWFPGIDAQILAGTLDPDAVTAVVAGMVIRSVNGPDGITQQSVGTGPYSQSYSYSNPNGNLYLTDADLTLILGYQPKAMSVSSDAGTWGC